MITNKKVFSVTKKDFEITWFSGTGSGGQHRNKHQNCCRLKHKATGIIKTGQAHRERLKNQKDALHSMADDKYFRAWCVQRLAEMEGGPTIEEWIEEQMQPKNLIVQVRDDNGKWVEENLHESVAKY